jgi:hypothetical protein
MQRGNVADRLDPDLTFCFYAYPASDPDPILNLDPFINESDYFEI